MSSILSFTDILAGILGRLGTYVAGTSSSVQTSQSFQSEYNTSKITSFSDDFIDLIDSKEKIEDIFETCRALGHLGPFQCERYAEQFGSLAKCYAWGLHGIEKNFDKSNRCFGIANRLLRLRDELGLLKEDITKDYAVEDDLKDTESFAPFPLEEINEDDKPQSPFEKEANIDKLDQWGYARIHRAAWSGDCETITELIRMGADINLVDSECGLTPLCLAVQHDQPIAVEVLIAAGADVNKTDISGYPPLLYSIYNETVDIFDQLVKANAEISGIISEEKVSILVYLKEQQSFRSGVMLSHLKSERRWRDPDPFRYQKQWIQTKLIAHAFGLRGEYNIQGHQIRGEGISPKLVGKVIAKSVGKFVEAFPDLLDKRASLDLIEGLQITTCFVHESEHLFNRIHNQEPAFIFTGFKGHAVTILLWKDLFAICNRGGYRFDTATYIGRFDLSKLDSSTIQDILDLRNKEEEEYYKAFCNGDESTILKKINFIRTVNDLLLEQKICLSNQKVGNCAWASTQTAVWLFLFLDSLRDENFILPSSYNECASIARCNFSRCSVLFLFVKIFLLENHIIDGFNPLNINKKLFYRLKRDVGDIPKRFQNYMFEKIKNLQSY